MSNERHETVADIVDEMRQDIANGTVGIWSDFGGEIARSYADRIEAAHNRELESTVEKSSVVGNAAAMREKAKPVRNCDKYKTAKGAFAGFNEMCDGKTCYRCPFSAERNECMSCMLNWLYSEADK